MTCRSMTGRSVFSFAAVVAQLYVGGGRKSVVRSLSIWDSISGNPGTMVHLLFCVLASASCDQTCFFVAVRMSPSRSLSAPGQSVAFVIAGLVPCFFA